MEKLIPRLFSPPKESFFLFGPRGTGKSTWLRKHFKEALWVDLLEPDTFRAFSARPERLTNIVLGNPKKKTVVIDEVQKVPDLLPVVHLLVEKKLGIQFILTGSSARKLKRAGVDLLAGRVVRQTLHPFMASELGNRFQLEKAIKSGLLPLVLNAADPLKVLQTYVSLYMREEVQMEGLVRNIGNFARFLEIVSFSHGNALNVSNISRECEIERKTIEGYVGILEDLLLAYRVPVFTKRAKRATATHPKFYFFDAGVYRSLRPAGPLDRPEEIDGAALEGLIAQHLLAWNAYRGDKNKLFYWRTQAGSEVDFILYGDVFWALKIKNSARVHPKDFNALKAFKEDYPESTPMLLYRGKERFKQGGILCLSCDDFVEKLHPRKLWR